MPFNTEMNPEQPPFEAGIMTLTNDECVEVKTACQKIKDDFVPTQWVSTPDMQYVVGTYNKQDWTKAINGDTYEVLERYNPETNTQGISPEYEKGIAPEPEIEEEQPDAPESPVTDETAPEGETSSEPETNEEEEIQGA